MPEFLRLLAPPEAKRRLLDALPNKAPVSESLATVHCLRRILAEDVHAPHSLPEFRRSTVDGYAVRAAETHGASESMPAYSSLRGEVPMGEASEISLGEGECALIHTGGMLPENADAVVMLEYAQKVHTALAGASGAEVEFYRPVAAGENVIQIGEDVKAGQLIMAKGVRVRPAEIGCALALGITEMRVAKHPGVGIISSGDEVIPPQQATRPGQVRDINSYTLGSLVESVGGEARQYGIVHDNLESLIAASAGALSECDMLIITAGSSASARDLTVQAIQSLGAPGVLVHGVNVRPGKPTILAVCDGKPVIGLPGNPVSALVVAGLFCVPVIEFLLGIHSAPPQPVLRATLEINVPSQAGREDWIAVRLFPGVEQGWIAEPIFAKSNLIFSLVSANGLLRIPADVTGYSAGEGVEVFLF